MSDRTWWPVDWADEIMPPGRPSPDGFIIDANGHYWLGYSFDAPDATEQDKRYFSQALDSGDLVKFTYCDDLGEIEVQIAADGSFTLLEGAVDPRATHFWAVGNSDSLSDSIVGYARDVADLLKDSPDEFPLRETVRMAFWPDDGLPYKLVPTLDDKGLRVRFEQVAAAEACQ